MIEGNFSRLRAKLAHVVGHLPLASAPGDVLERDARMEFCRKKIQKSWLWTAIPDEYKRCHTFSDFWIAYQQVFPAETHRCVGKETGETAHMERWNNTLRQRVGCYVRQTLSFSKADISHYLITKWFIIQYNLNLSLTT
jgi:IS1 family transposase